MPFRDIVGHRGVTTLIARAITRGTFPPSVILTGPEGVGKRLTAMAIAEAVNCVEPRTGDADFAVDACGECSVCRRIGRRVFPDVVVVEPPDSASGAITVDQVRDVVEQAAYRPFEGRRRIVAIDDADSMAPQAQNALLKTLEEPPPSSQFILVAERSGLLLDTVRSRCPQLRFGLLTDAEIADLLTSRHGIEPRRARAAAASAAGSVGRALRSASGELAASRDVAVHLLESVASARDVRGRLDGARRSPPDRDPNGLRPPTGPKCAAASARSPPCCATSRWWRAGPRRRSPTPTSNSKSARCRRPSAASEAFAPSAP